MKVNVLKFAVILLFFAGVFYSCNDNNTYFGTAECGKFNVTETEFVSWCIVPYEVTRYSVNVQRLENRTEKMLIYDAYFSLEYFSRNKWTSIQLSGVNWEMIGYVLYPYETSEEVISLYSLVNEFNSGKKGKYRIIRNYTLRPCLPSGFETAPCLPTSIGENITLYTEFIIK